MKFYFSLLFSIMITFGHSQNYEYQKHSYAWPNASPDLSKMTNVFSDEDIVVIDEKISLNWFSLRKTLEKKCIIKINHQKGINKISTLRLPESFDLFNHSYNYRQGRFADRKMPYIHDFKVIYMAARVMKTDGRIIKLEMPGKIKKSFWVEKGGNHLDDFCYEFPISGLETGDILEYSYKVEFDNYEGNLFYFNSLLPKQLCRYEVIFNGSKAYDPHGYICDLGGSEQIISQDYTLSKGMGAIARIYTVKNLQKVNYPMNMCGGKILPHIYISERIFKKRVITNNPFGWKFSRDTINTNHTTYNKKHENIRKYLTRFKDIDSEKDLGGFLKALCDSINTLKFMSAESMNYSGNAQYSVISSEWLLKGKLAEEFLSDIYIQILQEKGIKYNIIAVHDKRFSEIKTKNRAELYYELRFISIPVGNKLIYIHPRFDGLKYHLDEIPFNAEGTIGALVYNNYGKTTIGNEDDYTNPQTDLHFVKTPSSNENENVRTENAVFNIDLDSSVAHVSIKQNLSGQFSTISRAAYLGESIDSTMNPIYFKRAVDKPFASNSKIKPTNRFTEFPYKHSFVCSQDIFLKTKNEVDIKKWFSFTLRSEEINELPSFDFYFDFLYTDTYNFMIQFDKAVEVLNLSDFTHAISNSYFELSSSLTPQSDKNYLLSVMVKVKQPVLPQKDGQLLLDIVKELDALNNASIKLK